MFPSYYKVIITWKLSRMKILILTTLLVMLSSCGTLGKLVPSFANQKDNQQNSSHSTNNGNGVGRDARVGLALSAGDNKSKSYADSNIKSKDFNLDNPMSLDESSYSIGGKHLDNSIKQIFSDSMSNSNRYNGQNIVVNPKDSLSQQLITFIIDFMNSYFTGIFSVLCFYCGWRSHTFKVNRAKKTKRIKNA